MCRAQVVVALEGGTMVYFELDATGALSEVRAMKEYRWIEGDG